MIIFYNTVTGKINNVLWSEELSLWYEMSSNESYIILDKDCGINNHKLHLCKLKLDEEGKPEEIEEPEIEYEGTFPMEKRKIKGWKKHKIIKEA